MPRRSEPESAQELVDRLLFGEVADVPPATDDANEIPLPDAFDCAVVRELGAASPLAVADAVASRIRNGGRLILLAQTGRDGWRGASNQLLGMLRRRRTFTLEELCEALLIAGFADLQARELRRGTSAVWGTFTRVPAGLPSSAR